jgi:orotidine-5'-phosphate decarboxylase
VSQNNTNKIIIALDYDNKRDVLNLCDQLDPKYCRLKVGKQLFTQLGPDIIELLHAKNFEIFLDLKFHDIPITVYKACIEAYKLGVWMLNIHLLGGSEMVLAAKQARDEQNTSALLIGVTLLTSHNDESLKFLNLPSRLSTVQRLAQMAQSCQIDGVVCAPSDINTIKEVTSDLVYVTPGIRLSDQNDDHDRIYTPKKAILAGSDYLVIGRPITESNNPMKVIDKIVSMI